MSKEFLKEGDVIRIEKGMNVYAHVPRHFLYSNTRGDFTMGHGEIRVDGSLEYFAGDYVVIKTSFEGGGRGGHNPHDEYPNGHRVYCESTEKPTRKIDFYQSGCFTCMLPDIKPIGRAKLKWVMEAEAPDQGGTER